MKFSSALVAAFAGIATAAAVDTRIDHAALAEMFQARGEAATLAKRCDMDFFETCMGTCPVGGACPGCQVGCTIGCCGSTGCC